MLSGPAQSVESRLVGVERQQIGEAFFSDKAYARYRDLLDESFRAAACTLFPRCVTWCGRPGTTTRARRAICYLQRS